MARRHVAFAVLQPSFNFEAEPARFRKPTVAEVAEYCLERGNGIDPEEFMDYYESVGWKIGKKTMQDWRACVRTWEKRRRGTLADTCRQFVARGEG